MSVLGANRIRNIGSELLSRRLDVGRPHHLAPFLDFIGDKLAELGWRTWKCGGAALLSQPRLHLALASALRWSCQRASLLALTYSINDDMVCGLRRACSAVDLGSCVAPLRFLLPIFLRKR